MSDREDKGAVRCERCEALRRGLPYPSDETEPLLDDLGIMCQPCLDIAAVRAGDRRTGEH
jgi:hypothetical protein